MLDPLSITAAIATANTAFNGIKRAFQVGKDIQAREQAGLDIAYQDFIKQRDFPRENLTFLSSILRGVPVQPSTETTQLQQYNPVKDLLGTGIAGLGLYRGLTSG